MATGPEEMRTVTQTPTQTPPEPPREVALLALDAKPYDTAALVPYARNSRTHTEEQVRQLAEAFKFYGFTVPVLIRPDGQIIAGHGRVMAAKLLGMPRVPVVVAEGWTDEQVKAYVIWDNRSAEMAGWDKAILKLEMADLHAAGFDVTRTGFTLEDAGLKAPTFEPVTFTARLDEKTPHTCPRCGHEFRT